MKRTGENGLPLILGGDWNDGMNRVGMEGRGRERLARLVPAARLSRGLAAIAREQGDTPRADRWEKHAGEAEARA